MSSRFTKKLRQLHRREFRASVQKLAEEKMRFYGSIIKPKPRFIPLWLWKWCLKRFLKVK
jgi:hypothetical protein